MNDWVEIFPSKRLRDVADLAMECALSSLKSPPLGEGVRNDVCVGEGVADLNVAHIEVAKDNVADEAGLLDAHAVIVPRVVNYVAVDQPHEQGREGEATSDDTVKESLRSTVLNDHVHE